MSDSEKKFKTLRLTLDGAETSVCGPDGIAAISGTTNQFIVVENGLCDTGRARIIKVTLDQK